jgi:hypothetical protein
MGRGRSSRPTPSIPQLGVKAYPSAAALVKDDRGSGRSSRAVQLGFELLLFLASGYGTNASSRGERTIANANDRSWLRRETGSGLRRIDRRSVTYGFYSVAKRVKCQTAQTVGGDELFYVRSSVVLDPATVDIIEITYLETRGCSNSHYGIFVRTSRPEAELESPILGDFHSL